MLVCTKAAVAAAALQPPDREEIKKAIRGPDPETALIKCPRCESTNTKFCYYNNYSLTQPRYLCKSCRRYWTKGGALRNVPVGGGSRKNSRRTPSPSSSSASSPLSSSAASKRTVQDHNHKQLITAASYSQHHDHAFLTRLPYHDSTATTSSQCSGGLCSENPDLQGQVLVSESGGFEFHDHGHGMTAILGNHINSHFENMILWSHNLGALNSIGVAPFLDHQSPSIHRVGNMYDIGTMEMNGGDHDGQIMGGASANAYDHQGVMTLPAAAYSVAAVAGVTEEVDGGRGIIGDDQLGRIRWGFPWQINDGGSMGGGGGLGAGAGADATDHLDSVRGNCISGLVCSSWHGLLQSPLM